MKEIGELLKAKRLEKGMTIEQIADKTRMPMIRIKAIEEGDISAFKDDLTYLQFFLQSYCNAVGISYQEIKSQLNESINQYTTSFEASQIREQIESEKNIREQSIQVAREYRANHPQKVKRKIDFSLITFVAVVALILICVVTVGGYYLTQKMSNPTPPTNIVDKPEKPEPQKPQDVLPETPEPEKTMEIVNSDVNHYVINNAPEKVVVKIEFVPSSWLSVTLDQVELTNPAAKIYDAGETLEIEMNSLKNKEMMLRFGFFQGMKLYVNDQELTIDSSIANNPNVQDIYITIGGNESESTQ